jgi:hypothetical protein
VTDNIGKEDCTEGGREVDGQIENPSAVMTDWTDEAEGRVQADFQLLLSVLSLSLLTSL